MSKKKDYIRLAAFAQKYDLSVSVVRAAQYKQKIDAFVKDHKAYVADSKENRMYFINQKERPIYTKSAVLARQDLETRSGLEIAANTIRKIMNEK